MENSRHMTALITGGSRGIGAAAALALAHRGCDIVITYRNKAARANGVVAEASQQGIRALALCSDITRQSDRDNLFAIIKEWSGQLDLLILNASGGLERDILALDPDYPMRINRDAQIALLDAALPLMHSGAVVVFVTSHLAHLYGQVEQIPTYHPIAESKHAGEQALRARQQELSVQGIRLLVVTGDLVEGTITPKLLERASPGLTEQRRRAIGPLPTATEMGKAIAAAAMDTRLTSGYTVVVGASLDLLFPDIE